MVIWITGLPGSGKSLAADGVKKRFPDFVVIRMDEMRKFVTPAPTYSEQERELVYRALVYTTKTLAGLGHDVIIDATGNLRRWRELARELIPGFMEIYLKCPVAVCRKREALRKDTRGAPRDIYLRGKAGQPVPGVSVPYEKPLNPELTIETGRTSPEEAAALIYDFIARKLSCI